MSTAKSKINSATVRRSRILLTSLFVGIVTTFILYYVWIANAGQIPGAGNRADAAVPEPADELTHDEINQAYGRIEMSFEANRGQTDPSVGFLARGAGYALFLKPDEAVFALSRKGADKRFDEMPHGVGPVGARFDAADPKAVTGPAKRPSVLRLKLLGANAAAEAAGADELAGRANYFIGNDPGKWRTDVTTYGRARYREVYKGVDVEYYGNQRQLEYDFHVAPGADYRQISLKFAGADSVKVEPETGDLLIGMDGQTVRQHKPVVYQEADGERREIEGRFKVDRARRVGFELDNYDETKSLIIDPVLVYSTYLGGNSDDAGYGIAVDTAGNAFVTGTTSSTNFPTVNPLQGSRGGGIDIFVTKINTTGNAFVYSTYLGGNANDRSYGIALDSSGNAYVTGYTVSTNFPIVAPMQGVHGGGNYDAFVTKINPNGSAIAFSTFLGGSADDYGHGIAVGSTGEVYVTGQTGGNFPIVGGTQINLGGNYDAFVAKINSDGSALVYSTYLGGNNDESGESVATDSAGNSYITGWTYSSNFPTANPIQAVKGTDSDTFITKINGAGSAMVYSTYMGGSGSDSGIGIAVDPLGNAYVAGSTTSMNFPTANAIQGTFGGAGNFYRSDAYVTAINAGGSALIYSTYLGGDGDDVGRGIAVDLAGIAYVTGSTGSTNFPTANPIQATRSGSTDIFITKISAGGSSLTFSTYFGGTTDEVAYGIGADSTGNCYITGMALSTNFPTAFPAQGTYAGLGDAFVSKIGEVSGPTPTPTPIPTPTPTPTPAPTPVPASAGDLVISQIYGGGGTAGATYRNSYVEIFNRKASPLITHAYAIALGLGTSPIDRSFGQSNSRGIVIQPGQYLLIRMGSGGNSGSDLPQPDLDVQPTFPSSFFGLSAKLALTGETANNSVFADCPLAAQGLLDFVGFGSTNCFEGSGPTVGLSVTTAALRKNNGCSDANDNASDFTIGAPNPRNSNSPFNPCFTPTPTPTPNTPVGTDVIVQESTGSSSITFSSVSQAGLTTFIPISPPSSGGMPPAGYLIVDTVPGFNITTSALYTGLVTVCIMVGSVSDPETFWRLRILHGEDSQLVDRTILYPDSPAPSFSARKICARVQTVSSFVVALQPTPTRLAISGRVMKETQTPIRNVTVIVTSDDTSRRVTTSSFGLFTVDNLEPGKTYTISAVSKRYRFSPIVMQLTDNVFDVQMVALE